MDAYFVAGEPQDVVEQYFTLLHLGRGDYDVRGKVFLNDNNIRGWDYRGTCVMKESDSRKYPDEFVKMVKPWTDTGGHFFSGIKMILNAAFNGYKDIYCAGLDNNYHIGSDNWAYNSGTMPPEADKNFMSWVSSYHDNDLQYAAIDFVNKMKGVNLWSLSKASPISKVIRMAPIIPGPPFKAMAKPKGWTADRIRLPELTNTFKPETRYPKWLVNFVCVFIANKKTRHRIRHLNFR